ncbi:MAG TPA: hypothetical protein VI959_03370, partial [Alphaproteobacteria bacterium]|nr:hypothetical protein [Alphaproteobacteria bacterium]
KPSTVVLAEIKGLDKPAFIKDGNQEILDSVINHIMTNDVASAVNQLSMESTIFKHFITPFSLSFKEKNFTVIHREHLLYRNKLKETPSNNPKLAPYFFTELSIEHPNAEYALVLDPKFFAVVRKYYSFIPLGAPKPEISAWLYLVDLKSTAIVGFYHEHIIEKVEGDWDCPPYFDNLTGSIKNTLSKFLQNAHNYFFPKT